ncbi:acylamino-acid-releasing enzyme [Lepeophtheirus salmonis]|uniref:acylamino-acid-releasing enzyme n=1 Tax=Lepeophtheirus salmonis TaxID=72036 RepID=UPI001AE17196|nr:acylamino-acid-releasing enzyme-like [Lepeophtheirus salmonis]XP_040571013.1 acylamino-acid-releasing enzyme-like [Lepeophtheirus salmonis]XP_040571014.1 acylamino-acid-releasing enzyme-like [Lepeophtheirus salmonis]
MRHFLTSIVIIASISSVYSFIDPKCLKNRRIERNHMIQDAVDEVFQVSSIQKARIQDNETVSVLMCNSKGDSKVFSCLNKLYELGNDSTWSKSEEMFQHGNTVFLDDSDWPNSKLELVKDDSKYYLLMTPLIEGNETTIDLTDGDSLRKDDTILSLEYNVESSEIACLIERKRHVFVGIFNIVSRTWSRVKSWPEEWTPEEVFWNVESELMGVAFRNDPFRQSRIFVTKRTKNKNKFQFLSPINTIVSHPRLTPDGKGLIYFQSDKNGTVIKFNPDVFANSKLSGDSSVLITDRIFNDGKVYGIYPANVPLRAFSSDGSKFYLSVHMESEVYLIVVHLLREGDDKIDVFDGNNLRLLDVYEDNLLLSKSDWNEFPKVFMANQAASSPDKDKGNKVEFKLVTDDVDITREKRYGWVKSGKSFFEKFSANYIAGTPLRPQMNKNTEIPIIVVLHGGPNTVKTSEHDRLINGLLASEFAVISINYRGSLGMCNESISSIRGYKMKNLMKEVKDGIADAVESSKSLDALRVGIIGIGFGGLIALELSNYHSKFEHVVLINPIVDLPQMRSSSNPEWVYDVLGMNYSYPQLPSMDFFNKSWEMSPLKFSKEYRRNYFMVLSEENKWILPETQGLMWHRFAGKPNTSRPVILQEEVEENPFVKTLHPKGVKIVLNKIIHYFHDIWENDTEHCFVEEKEQIIGQRYASTAASISQSSLIITLFILFCSYIRA